MTDQSIQSILELLDALEKNELLLGRLYQVCAEQWPEDKEFWTTTEQDEYSHAQYINEMKELLQDNPAEYKIGHSFNKTAAETTRKWVKDITEKVKNGEISKIKILNIAKDLEQSLLESKFHELLNSSNVEYNTLANKITTETRQHLEKVKDKIKEST
ncbi:MAG: hypothetical protein R6V04_09660 [bacterium]